jgi:hypothetical protein
VGPRVFLEGYIEKKISCLTEVRTSACPARSCASYVVSANVNTVEIKLLDSWLLPPGDNPIAVNKYYYIP